MSKSFSLRKLSLDVIFVENEVGNLYQVVPSMAPLEFHLSTNLSLHSMAWIIMKLCHRVMQYFFKNLHSVAHVTVKLGVNGLFVAAVKHPGDSTAYINRANVSSAGLKSTFCV